VDADTEFLCLLNADAKVLVTGDENGITNRSFSRERDPIRNDPRVDSLLFAGAVHETRPECVDSVFVRQAHLRSRQSSPCQQDRSPSEHVTGVDKYRYSIDTAERHGNRVLT
jgi:hypothetical protein